MKTIVLKTTESDVNDFYVNILGGKITGKYELPEKEAIEKYNLATDVVVFNVKLKSHQLTLLVYEVLEHDSFQHIYMEVKNPEEIYSKAVMNKFRTYHKMEGKVETFFLKDNNFNLFELKSKKQAKQRKQVEA